MKLCSHTGISNGDLSLFQISPYVFHWCLQVVAYSWCSFPISFVQSELEFTICLPDYFKQFWDLENVLSVNALSKVSHKVLWFQEFANRVNMSLVHTPRVCIVIILIMVQIMNQLTWQWLILMSHSCERLISSRTVCCRVYAFNQPEWNNNWFNSHVGGQVWDKLSTWSVVRLHATIHKLLSHHLKGTLLILSELICPN